MDEQGILQELGLTELESKVYIALVELGSSKAGEIIKKTGFHRGTTYKVLQRLKEKGLVSSVSAGKQFFQAVAPKRLRHFLEEKKAHLEELIPLLEERQKRAGEKQAITVYMGVRGVKSALDQMLEELKNGGEYFDFGV